MNDVDIYLLKAEESLESADADCAAGRYNSCANRLYYACLQAAIGAVLRAGTQRRRTKQGKPADWGHEFAKGELEGDLIYRRKRYPSDLVGTLDDLRDLRAQADYDPILLGAKPVQRALRRARMFVHTLTRKGGEGE